MIWADRENPRYRKLHLFLTPKERERLETWASEDNDWQPGQRQGSEHYKLDIKEYCAYKETLPWLYLLAGKARGELEIPDDAEIDACLLYYPAGGWGLGWHKDPAPPGKKYICLNAIVKECAEGGDFVFEELPGERPRVVTLHEGSAIVFSPSQFEHCLKGIKEGQQLVLSIGALVDE